MFSFRKKYRTKFFRDRFELEGGEYRICFTKRFAVQLGLRQNVQHVKLISSNLLLIITHSTLKVNKSIWFLICHQKVLCAPRSSTTNYSLTLMVCVLFCSLVRLKLMWRLTRILWLRCTQFQLLFHHIYFSNVEIPNSIGLREAHRTLFLKIYLYDFLNNFYRSSMISFNYVLNSNSNVFIFQHHDSMHKILNFFLWILNSRSRIICFSKLVWIWLLNLF